MLGENSAPALEAFTEADVLTPTRIYHFSLFLISANYDSQKYAVKDRVLTVRPPGSPVGVL